MTSNLPPDAQYFRGETLTPESPAPLHIPEPSHIPVLQNQHDPIFNLMSTHITPSLTSSVQMGPEIASSQHGPSRGTQANAHAASSSNGMLDQGGPLNRHEPDEGDRDYLLAFDDEDSMEDENTDNLPNHSSSSAAQPSTSVVAHKSLSPNPPDVQLSSALNQSQEQVPAILPASPALQSQPTHNAAIDEDKESSDDSDDQMQDGGVNYQALLDNLTPSSATAPSAENITSITTAAPSTEPNIPKPSSADSPISTLPLPPGLPPRPPPQEKPAIHPNYTTGEDIRSYHFPHAPNPTNPNPTASQANNPIKPVQALNHPLPPNASVGSNGLPPPPLATFQQHPSQTAPSPITPRSRPPDRESVALESNQDEAPWPSQLEELYNVFLNEEAVYVAEGVWDRFPPGSRLFVGTYMSAMVRELD